MSEHTQLLRDIKKTIDFLDTKDTENLFTDIAVTRKVGMRGTCVLNLALSASDLVYALDVAQTQLEKDNDNLIAEDIIRLLEENDMDDWLDKSRVIDIVLRKINGCD